MSEKTQPSLYLVCFKVHPCTFKIVHQQSELMWPIIFDISWHWMLSHTLYTVQGMCAFIDTVKKLCQFEEITTPTPYKFPFARLYQLKVWINKLYKWLCKVFMQVFKAKSLYKVCISVTRANRDKAGRVSLLLNVLLLCWIFIYFYFQSYNDTHFSDLCSTSGCALPITEAKPWLRGWNTSPTPPRL